MRGKTRLLEHKKEKEARFVAENYRSNRKMAKT